eukprot:TRINITY_DN72318_c1_g1_i1.p1 TRINITY_DN72318_c1_g1~~TRINITY_DN72318_c1_g1_i1.p1  ORF type:complete len:591 (+),score=79.47 TRINITY_DN72318_c1_g1_i1:43-1773(+)
MGKKRKAEQNEEEQAPSEIWCFYCGIDMPTFTALFSHQKSKHFRCQKCPKKGAVGDCNSMAGLMIHTRKFHGVVLDRVPNSIEGRTDPSLNIVGMSGIPEDMYTRLPPKKKSASARPQMPLSEAMPEDIDAAELRRRALEYAAKNTGFVFEPPPEEVAEEEEEEKEEPPPPAPVEEPEPPAPEPPIMKPPVVPSYAELAAKNAATRPKSAAPVHALPSSIANAFAAAAARNARSSASAPPPPSSGAAAVAAAIAAAAVKNSAIASAKRTSAAAAVAAAFGVDENDSSSGVRFNAPVAGTPAPSSESASRNPPRFSPDRQQKGHIQTGGSLKDSEKEKTQAVSGRGVAPRSRGEDARSYSSSSSSSRSPSVGQRNQQNRAADNYARSGRSPEHQRDRVGSATARNGRRDSAEENDQEYHRPRDRVPERRSKDLDGRFEDYDGVDDRRSRDDSRDQGDDRRYAPPSKPGRLADTGGRAYDRDDRRRSYDLSQPEVDDRRRGRPAEGNRDRVAVDYDGSREVARGRDELRSGGRHDDRGRRCSRDRSRAGGERAARYRDTQDFERGSGGRRREHAGRSR